MKTIAVAIDGSAGSRRALSWAARTAAASKRKLSVMTAWEYPSTTALPGAAERLPSAAAMDAAQQEMLDLAVEEASSPTPPPQVTTSVLRGAPAPTINRHLDRTGADAVVVGSRGLGGFEGLLLGSVSRQLLEHASCTIVVVPSADTSVAGAGDGPPRRIVVGVDGSPGSRRALEWAGQLAHDAGAEIVVVQALIEEAWHSDLPAGSYDETVRRQQRELAEDYGPGLDRLGVTYTITERGGDPRQVLLDAADDAEADLIVVGSRGAGRFSRTVLGSVSATLVQWSAIPVAVVPTR